ncbi:MAG TPA: SigE family RNA polymerase sigma factor [Mycobacteriales bacterium]|nr:SigE family RNA polymerase sigma factor [Mycobacteriales bacterium]
MRREWERDFVDYVSARALALRRTAYLLSGDWHAAEDLTQATLTKLYLAWRKIDRAGSVDAYARRTLVRTFLDSRRRLWSRERPHADVPEQPAPTDLADDRIVLWHALDRLPANQRAVIVLRYWEDLSVAETAVALNMSEGTVKSSASRGLAALREGLQGSRTAGAGDRDVRDQLEVLR